MHDATVSGMCCTGPYGAITQGKFSEAADHAAAGRATPVSPADAP